MPRTPTVVLTRQPEDNAPLRALLEARGLGVIEAPCVAAATIEPPEAETRRLPPLGALAAAAFASRRGVEGFFAWLAAHPERDAGRPALIGAVGPATAKALAARGWPADVVAEPATGEALARALV
ncbi:MAG: hypothetical protein C4523_19340, partial [Myxococcales bacterium]